MSDEMNKDIEQIDAEVVQEGQKAATMPNEPHAPEPPKPEFSEADKQEYTSYSTSGSSQSFEDEPENTGKAFGIVSLICGALSAICCCMCWLPVILGIAGIVFGILSLKKEPTAKPLAIIGIVLGSLGGVMGILCVCVKGIGESLRDVLVNNFNMEDVMEQFEEYM